MSKKNILIGLLAGAAAGAVAGILLAPDKGSKTRKKISKKTSDTANGIKTHFNDFVDSMVNKFSKASDEVSEKLEKVKTAVTDVK